MWVGVDTSRSTFNAYGVNGLPDTFIIDKTGTVVLRTRPSLQGDGRVFSQSGVSGGGPEIGISITAYTARDILAMALRVLGSHILGELGDEPWDVIYSRPRGSSMDKTQ